MRIGLVVEEFDPHRGGVEHWAVQFVSQLLMRGHEVHVVARRFCDQALCLPIIAHGLEDVRSRLGFAAAAERVLRGLELDVIHDTGAGWYCDVFQPHGGSRHAATRQNLLLVAPGLRRWKAGIQRILPRYRQFDALAARQYADDGRVVLALSHQVAADFRRYYNVAEERIRLIYNGVDTERFSPVHRAQYRLPIRRRLGIDDATVLYLIVAHNFRLKGVPTLLRTIARMKASGQPVHLAVVGGKGLRPWFRAARRAGAADVVSFTGAVEDAVPYYAAADVYVQPTFYDPCSLVVLEALASGLPVVTSRFNGAGELLTPERDGLLIADPNDVGQLQMSLERLLSAPIRRAMGEAARQLALKHTLTDNVDRVLEIYQEIVCRRRAERPARGQTPGEFVFRRRIGGLVDGQTPSNASHPTRKKAPSPAAATFLPSHDDFSQTPGGDLSGPSGALP